jgi:PST family polysaccharide transporter
LEKKNSSYNQILKSTSIFGGSQILVILIGVIRNKMIAVLLGPVGVGIIGIYNSVIEMIRSAGGLGMDTTGVKEIAEADSSGDKELFYKTVSWFNKWFRAMALCGAMACLIFSYPISIWAFEDSSFTFYIACLSVCVFLAILTMGRSSILQGMRRIPEMAKSAFLGSFFGMLISIPAYLLFGLDGILPAFVFSSLLSFLCVEFYYRKLHLKKIDISNKEAFESGLKALKLGLFIVIAGFIGTASMFFIKTFIARSIDMDAAGLFQSAWVITNIYLSLILRSMGSDFFPRLSAIANEGEKVRKLVNEQSYIILVVASPIIVGMLLFADFTLSVLYSSEFGYADAVLRWQVTGTFFKVLCWPVAFIMLAKNKGAAFLVTEIIFYLVYLLSGYLLFPKYGLEATGIGYLIAYAVYLPVIILAGKAISGFTWDSNIIKMAVINLLFIGTAFYIAHYYTGGYGLLSGIGVLVISLVYAYIKLKKVFSISELQDWFKKK